MRFDKIVAQILLIFSLANVALAAPTVVRQGHPVVAKAASKKRYLDSDGEAASSEEAGAASAEPGSHASFSASTGDAKSWSLGSDRSAPLSPTLLAAWRHLQRPAGSEPESPALSQADELAANPEANTFFDDALKKKLIVLGGAAAVLGVSGSVLYELYKLNYPPQSKPVGRDLASSDVVGHGAGTPFHGLLHHLEKPRCCGSR